MDKIRNRLQRSGNIFLIYQVITVILDYILPKDCYYQKKSAFSGRLQ